MLFKTNKPSFIKPQETIGMNYGTEYHTSCSYFIQSSIYLTKCGPKHHSRRTTSHRLLGMYRTSILVSDFSIRLNRKYTSTMGLSNNRLYLAI